MRIDMKREYGLFYTLLISILIIGICIELKTKINSIFFNVIFIGIIGIVISIAIYIIYKVFKR